MERTTIQKYLNNFRRRISPYLKRNIGIIAKVYPYTKGVVILLEFGEDYQNNDEYMEEFHTANEIFNFLNIKAFGGIADNIEFGGTNSVMFDNKIVFIKDFKEKEWNDSQAQSDIDKIVQPSKNKRYE